MKHFGDITKINGHDIPLVDIVTGGSPCQDLSVAGKRAGLSGERSGLFMEQIRIIKEMRNECVRQLQMQGSAIDIRCIRPRFMVWENVPGAFSSNKGEDFRAVLEETAKVVQEDAVIPRPSIKWSNSGAIMGDGWSIAWRVHDAQFWGVPQRRKRISLVADFGGESAPEILFERKSLSGDIEESREEGEGVTTDIEGSIDKAIGVDAYNQTTTGEKTMSITGAATDPHHIPCTVYCLQGNGIDRADTAGCNGKGWRENQSYTLNTIDRPAVCIENHPADSRVKISEDGVVQTLSSRMGTGGGNVPMVMENQTYQKTTGSLCASGYDKLWTQEALNDMYVVQNSNWDGSQIAPTLTANNAGGSQRMPDKDNFNAVITYGLDRASFNQGQNAKYNFSIEEEKIGSQVARGPGAVCNQSVVRRLTPLECERLQGYPDGWTDIGEWTDSKGKKRQCTDGNRYKALGNSIALPYWSWMAGRMVEVLKADGVENPTMASLFDGIGGFPLVYSRNGCEPIWASEIEEFPIAVTKRRFPDD